MRVLAMLAGAAIALTACAAQQVASNPPTVTYAFTEETFDEVAMRADDYCETQYGRDAYLVDRDREGGGYEATFACE